MDGSKLSVVRFKFSTPHVSLDILDVYKTTRQGLPSCRCFPPWLEVTQGQI